MLFEQRQERGVQERRELKQAINGCLQFSAPLALQNFLCLLDLLAPEGKARKTNRDDELSK